MSGFKNINIDTNSISMDAGGRTRISQMTTLLDGKVLNRDNTNLFCSGGTGTHIWSSNTVNMSVDTGQYVVRQTKRFYPYSSGKSQIIECSFDNFQIQTGVTKRVGYFSSSPVEPYTGSTDGFYLENDGITFRLKAENMGVTTINVPWTSWDNYSLISGYTWSNFTIIAFDFLWLGGSALRIFLKTELGFVLCHTYNYPGSSTGTFINSPNQPIRYTIRSTTGSGSFRYICSQISTEGSIEESGYRNAVYSISTAAIPSNTISTIGTIYPLKSIRKKQNYRDSTCKLTGVFITVSSTNDRAIWSVQLNPTLSAPLTYVDLSPINEIEQANGSDVAAISITVTSPGKILSMGIITFGNILSTNIFEKDFLQYLGCDLNNVMDELVLCIQPITSTITINGGIEFKEF